MAGLIGTLERQLNEINRALEETARIIEEASMHTLYKTGDADAPASIKDRNGEVALGLCRHCGAGEIELEQRCPEVGIEEDQICRRDGCEGVINFEDVENCSCHINAPCANHQNQMLACNECGVREDDDGHW